jgi:hypothetical protein
LPVNINAAQIARVQQFFVIALVLKKSGEPSRTVAYPQAPLGSRRRRFTTAKSVAGERP